MIFYNGFNLLVDIVIAFIVYKVAYSAGYRAGEDENAPPF